MAMIGITLRNEDNQAKFKTIQDKNQDNSRHKQSELACDGRRGDGVANVVVAILHGVATLCLQEAARVVACR